MIDDLRHLPPHLGAFQKIHAGDAFVILACIAAVLILTACGSLPYERAPDRTIVTVRVHWLTPEGIIEQCGPNTAGCAPPASATSLQEIYAVKPQGFDDETAITRLGHEFLHTLGATHR